MLLIYVQKITPRVSYTFKQICKRILGLEIDFTSKIESFIAHDGPKFSYGKKPLGKELYFQSVELLFEHGLNEVETQVVDWEDTKCFFQVKHANAALPFDIFAASFYLLSRYEEYLPHVKDDLGRFMVDESIAFKGGFLQDPVVDIWAYKLKEVILEKYPEIQFGKRKFRVIPIVTVSQTFAYRQKGILRSVGGGLRDLWFLKLGEFTDRIRVLMGFKKDPYDTFDELIRLQIRKKRDLKVLFGLGDYSNYEKNINHNNQKHRSLIKHAGDYIDIGLKVSYEAISNLSVLKKEKERVESIVNRQLKNAICAFFKIRLPEAYRNYIELEIREDFSMGYPGYSGFRAGTCTPFMFYDLDYEVQTPLIINSFCFSNYDYRKGENEALVREELMYCIKKIKEVQGVFIPVFHNELFSELKGQPFWGSVFEEIWNLEDETYS
ncbi:polysaccharide deacetylase family protein [Aquimarina sp. 2201CG5-10]|uniref:polysaccharide deacetylase family protein n=1 Tax=Aquimarina callyspongiae TaxID=3098150 RepID=UPI002AB3FF27|nr:polysaccharide deacetylase family protein [Aquimarina sp. 2201CG5-10]MDY8134442.1 polysaccharide deacetylase family protein [Aquimarina sp. 2201CG5-10]